MSLPAITEKIRIQFLATHTYTHSYTHMHICSTGETESIGTSNIWFARPNREQAFNVFGVTSSLPVFPALRQAKKAFRSMKRNGKQ